MQTKITLKELTIGDVFYPASKINKPTPYYQVTGNPEFNAGHGSATRQCRNRVTGKTINKSCRLEVVVKGFVKDGKFCPCKDENRKS